MRDSGDDGGRVVAVVTERSDGYHGIVEHVDHGSEHTASADSLATTLRALAAVAEGQE